MTGARRLLSRLRALMAAGGDGGGAAALHDLTTLVAAEMVAEVCAIYAMRPGDLLELRATHGLNLEAVGRTRLRVGEGIVGIAAATGDVQNLPDAQNHPAFAYRPETGEDKYASLLAVPIRRAGRTLGVLTVQNRAPRRYTDDEIEVLETVAMLLAEVLSASGVADAMEGVNATLPRQFDANPIAPGLAMGPLVLHGIGAPVRRLLADDPAAELIRLHHAAATMRRALDDLIAASSPDGDGAREVLEVTRLVSADEGWMRRVREAIEDGLSAEAAIHRVSNEVRERMRRVSDPYLRERLADLEDLAERMLVALDDDSECVAIPKGAILLARRLGPAQLLEWHARGIGGVVIEEGSTAGHAAILARALGLAAVGGASGVLEAVEDGDEGVLDADEGQFILRPAPEIRTAYLRELEVRRSIEARYAAIRHMPAQTRDGVPLTLQLNVGLAREVEQLDNTGAAGIGLFRTEVAMLARGEVIDVPEQAALYSRVLDAAGDKPVRFRTLDLGGDKLLPDAPPLLEENPAMGWRSLRIGLDRPVMLRRQLRALLLAAGGRRLSVMFPMVSTVAEFRAAKNLLYTEAARVRPAPSRIDVGSMIEVPALLFQLPLLMREADFVSIGSNDLMQFLFAADRGTPGLANRYDVLSPPVLDVLERIATEAAAAGVELSICGEHASRPLEAMAFAALGITTLSMPAPSLLRLKSVMAGVDLAGLRAVLATLRRSASGQATLRDPIASWAREHGVVV
ncbi:MAG TPA: putative PEP-binding protein [Acetobacteraceae bacterium]|nr:putative PEP-binding protein [Acetobacteraceae bacterium]